MLFAEFVVEPVERTKAQREKKNKAADNPNDWAEANSTENFLFEISA